MAKYFFEDKNSELCYSFEYFKQSMMQNNITEMDVYLADLEKQEGFFWCKKYNACGDASVGSCGKQCPEYKPRNGKSGSCVYYCKNLYKQGKLVTLKL